MKRYVIFGNGRVGANIASYLEHLGAEVWLITRDDAQNKRNECEREIARADIVMAALPDDKILPWYEEWRDAIGAKPAIHFSGAVVIKGMHGFHPLYSFPASMLSADVMKDIAFACSVNGPSFNDIFPEALNPSFEIMDADRARYHALAVLSGNLVSYIWNETAKELATLSDLPSEKLMAGYLNCIVDRFVESPTGSQTGPVMRRDAKTVEKNLSSLDGNAELKSLYKAFLSVTWPDYNPDYNSVDDPAQS